MLLDLRSKSREIEVNLCYTTRKAPQFVSTGVSTELANRNVTSLLCGTAVGETAAGEEFIFLDDFQGIFFENTRRITYVPKTYAL